MIKNLLKVVISVAAVFLIYQFRAPDDEKTYMVLFLAIG
jgi:hypothetical protein